MNSEPCIIGKSYQDTQKDILLKRYSLAKFKEHGGSQKENAKLRFPKNDGMHLGL